MIPNQVRALVLSLFFLYFWTTPVPVSAIQNRRQAPRDNGPPQAAPAERGEQAEQIAPEDPAEADRPTRRPGLLPVEVIAEADLGARTVGPAVFHEGTFIIATTSGEVSGLDAATLSSRWKLGLPGAELFPPCLLRNGILIASRAGSLVLLRPETGEILTEVSVDASIAVPPIWDGSTLFVATPDRDVIGYDVEKGQEIWRSKLQTPALALSTGAGLLLVSDRSGGLHALEAGTGQLRWQFQGRGNFEAPAVFDEARERLYLGDTAGFFYSISTREGNVQYRWANGAAIAHSVLLEEDRLLVATYANTLFSYRTGNGHELWRANLPGRPAAAPVRARRQIVVVTLNGQVVEYSPVGQPGALTYAAPEDILPFPTFLPQGMLLPLRSGKLLLLHTRQLLPSEAAELGERQGDQEGDEEGLDEPDEVPQDPRGSGRPTRSRDGSTRQ